MDSTTPSEIAGGSDAGNVCLFLHVIDVDSMLKGADIAAGGAGEANNMVEFLLLADLREFLLVIDAESLYSGAVNVSDGARRTNTHGVFPRVVNLGEFLLVIDADSTVTGVDIAASGE
jgi:hypothetical protein